MDEDIKYRVIKWIRALYLRVIIANSHYHDLSYINDEGFYNALEVIYLIIEDVCKNENIDISDVECIGNGAYSSVLLVGDKVIKIGLKRVTMRFPNNPYICAMLLRKEIPINDKESFFVEVNERVDDKSKVSEEELYNLYRKMRDINLIWLDVNERNVGRLYRDNKVHWREELPINDEVLGLDKYRGNEVLKEGDIVILDNDMIYDENSPYLFRQTSSSLQKKFEIRYKHEKV